MKSPYYCLFVLDPEQRVWGLEFGSYDKSDVIYEQRDMQDHGHRLSSLVVHRFEHCPTDGQVNETLSTLNAKLKLLEPTRH